MSRNTWRWFQYDARCDDCGWECCGKNVLGVAAQHHDRYGHDVRIEVVGNVSYLKDSSHETALAEKATQGDSVK